VSDSSVQSPTQTTIILVRHGESTWFGRWKGQGDPPLSEAGRDQALLVAERLALEPIAALYCSDLLRAAETAQIVGEHLGLTPQADRLLRELDVGEWSGLTREEIAERFPVEYAAWRNYDSVRPPGGETFDEMQVRAVASLQDLLAAHPGQTVCVVTHGGVVFALRGHVLGIPRSAELFANLPPNRNTALTVLRYNGDQGEVVTLMDASHLD
jgi:broad specificity phosphatase PhoE